MSRNFILIFFISVVVLIGGFLVISQSTQKPEMTTVPTFVLTPTPEVSDDIMSAMKIEDIQVGTGQEVKSGDTVVVHYTGTLENGTKFDSSVDRGTPFTTQIGVGMVIRGWDEGIPGMKVGGKRKLTIPSQLAYGEQGAPPAIPANATLVFEVEVLEVK